MGHTATMSSAEVKWSGNTLSVSPSGFRWGRSDGTTFAGPWSRVTSVMTFIADTRVNGIPTGTWQHLGMTFDNGASLLLRTTSREAFPVAELAVRYAMPVLLPKLRAELEAGHEVVFGSVSLSKTTLTVKKRRIPLAEVAGHKTYQGCWMVDVNPALPRLSGTVMLTKLPNYPVLMALLDQVLPGRRYAEDGPDLGTVLRPSASSHDPRYLSGRGRLMIIGAMLGIGAVVGAGFLASEMMVDYKHDKAQAALDLKVGKAIALAQQQAVPPGALYRCEGEPVRFKDEYDVIYATRAPDNIPAPGLVRREMPFALYSGSPSVLGPFTDSEYLAFAEFRSLSKPDAQNEQTGVVAVTLVHLPTHRIRCSGEVTGRFVSGPSYVVSMRLQDLMLRPLCSEGRGPSGCKGAVENITLLSPGARVAAP